MNGCEYEALAEDLKNLDGETKEKMQEILDRMLEKIRKKDPERYKTAIKKAEEEFKRHNGGNDSGGSGSESSEVDSGA